MKKEKSPKQASQLGTQLWVSVSRFTKGKLLWIETKLHKIHMFRCPNM